MIRFLLFVILICNILITRAQLPDKFFDRLYWRQIGPARGGRSLAVCGDPSNDHRFYFGATGGGIWISDNGGHDWQPVNDSVFGSSSVGCIAVAPSAPYRVYAGMGEAEMRGNISFGDGMYRSDDSGKTWKHIGLKNSFAIGRIVVHPTNPDVVYVAALGNVFKKDTERGLFVTTDGGQTWKNILFHSDSVGAVDVALHPKNPEIIYASMWQARRGPYFMSSGGEGSGLYRSINGGKTWEKLHTKPGMPLGILGKIEVAVSPADPNRIWAMIENAKHGGLYRSDNGGEVWQKINDKADLKQRPWYFSEIVAHPTEPQTIYVLNVNFWKSTDGGKTFEQVNVQHGDNHDLWINPNNPNIMALANDGSVQISFDGGKSWSLQDLPTAQFYHVSVDNNIPNYGIYGAQQDNSTVKVPARTNGYNISVQDWFPVAGYESGYVIPHPKDPHITFGGNYQGYISRYDDRTGENRNIMPWPISLIGAGADEHKYRFQWTFPIVYSTHTPNTLYITSQYVHKSTDEGLTWEIISPDLTRAEPHTLVSSGGPITKDNTGVEIYATIFSFAESPLDARILWAGSDDGLLHVTTDGGQNWAKINVPGMPDRALITCIEPDRTNKLGCYITATMYKTGDTKPYVFKTTNGGATWSSLAGDLPAHAYCRVIRQDPAVPHLLYLGTETGVFASFKDGKRWYSIKGNLPLTPIHDIAIQPQLGDVVLATHGRSFWVLDHQMLLRQLATDSVDVRRPFLIKTEPHILTRSNSGFGSGAVGENAPGRPVISYYLPDTAKSEVKLVFLNSERDTVTVLSSRVNKKNKPKNVSKEFVPQDTTVYNGYLPVKAGINYVYWDMRYADAEDTESPALLWGGSVAGPRSGSGIYTVAMYIGDTLIGRQPLEVLVDPRIKDYNPQAEKENLRFQLLVRNKLSEVHQTVNRIRKVQKQIDTELAITRDTARSSELRTLAKPLTDTLSAIEQRLIQNKAAAIQDLLAHPIRLNNMLTQLSEAAESMWPHAPTKATLETFKEVAHMADNEILKVKRVLAEQLPEINRLILESRAVPINAE